MNAKTLENLIENIVRRILTVVSPRKIYLFGSAARGTMHDNSDIDLLVVIPDGLHRRRTAQNIYRNLLGIGYAADIVVVTEEDIEKFDDDCSFVIQPALREGRIVYAG